MQKKIPLRDLLIKKSNIIMNAQLGNINDIPDSKPV